MTQLELVTDPAFRVPIAFDYVATFAWAASGAMVGIRKRYDITGVFVIALLSAAGGGMLRDGFVLQRIPVVLLNPVYLPLIAGATLLMTVISRRLTHVIPVDTFGKLVNLIDALGTPAFSVYGMQLAQNRGMPAFGVIFVGVLNGMAGGLLRDIVVRDVPTLLRPGQFTSLTLVLACTFFLVATQQYHVSPMRAAWITVGGFFLLRVLAVYFNWQTSAILRETEDSGLHERPRIDHDAH
jgi:uncharacterized membrane protein YeiH